MSFCNQCFGLSETQRTLAVLLVTLTAWCHIGVAQPASHPGASGSSKPAFTEVTFAAGITNLHHKPILDHQLDNIMSWVCSVGAAAAAVDYNNDGLIDLYVTDSRQGYPNHLYRNNGDGTFTDVAVQAGLAWVNTEGKES